VTTSTGAQPIQFAEDPASVTVPTRRGSQRSSDHRCGCPQLAQLKMPAQPDSQGMWAPVIADFACPGNRHFGVRGRRHSLLNPRPSCRCASLSHCRCAAPSNSPCRHTNRVKKWWKQRPVSQCPSIDGRRNPSSWHFPTSSGRSYARFGVPGPSNRPSWNMLHWPSLYPGWRQSSPTTPCRLAALTPIVVDRSRPNCRR